MADYSHFQPHSMPRAERGRDQRHYGWAATLLAAVVLAAMAWFWTQQLPVDSLLPQPAGQAAGSVAQTPTDRSAPAMTRAAPQVAPQVAPPSSPAVAASGDTRALRP